MNNFKISYSFRAAQLYFQLFLLLLVPLALAYAIYTRTSEDFITYAGRIAFTQSALIHLWLPSTAFRLAVEENRPVYMPPLKHLAIFSFGASALSIPIGVIFYSLGVVLIDAWTNFRNWEVLITQRPIALAFGTIAVLTAGLFFFWFRQRARFVYGVTETLAGVAFALHRLADESVISIPSNNDFYFAMLTAGVYLIVRGLDNMHIAWRDQTDPLARILFRLGTQSDLVAVPTRRLKSSMMVKKPRGRVRSPR